MRFHSNSDISSGSIWLSGSLELSISPVYHVLLTILIERCRSLIYLYTSFISIWDERLVCDPDVGKVRRWIIRILALTLNTLIWTSLATFQWFISFFRYITFRISILTWDWRYVSCKLTVLYQFILFTCICYRACSVIAWPTLRF